MTTTKPQDMKPELQIIHVSDWHFRDPAFTETARLGFLMDLLRQSDRFETWLRAALKLKKPRGWLQQKLVGWEDGLGAHNDNAIECFRTFIRQATVEDDDWRSGKTWLVDTGDLTTFGDDESLRVGHDLLRQFAAEAGDVEIYNIHGNHDAWPCTQPFLSNDAAIDTHKRKLRAEHFPYKAPALPLRHVMRSGDAICLYRLNSVLHDRKTNALALGEIQHDRYWESAPRPQSGKQLDDLRNDASLHLDASKDRHVFRIALSHHPVFDPPHLGYGGTMTLLNSRQVQRAMHPSAADPRLGKLCHLLLSGHTHQLYPGVGELQAYHDTLEAGGGVDPLQLVIGSLMKNYTYGQHEGGNGDKAAARHEAFNRLYPHQVQLLRFYSNPAQPGTLELRRILAARGAGAGAYKLVPANPNQVEEVVTLNY